MNFERPQNPQEQNEKFEQQFEWSSEWETGEIAMEKAEEELKNLGWKEESAYDFSLAVKESVDNAVVHGNLSLQKIDGEENFYERIKAAAALEENKDKRVKVFFKFTKDLAVAEVVDAGNYVPPPKKFSPMNESGHAFNETVVTESGKGLGLIWDKVTGVEFFPGKVIFWKSRKDAEDAI